MENDPAITAFLHRTYPELAEGTALPNGPLACIKLEFARGFAHWEIALPQADVETRRVETMLAAKGFGMEGNEPFSVQIQRYQRLEETKGT